MRKIGFVIDSTFGYKGNEATVVPLKVIVDGKEYIDGTIDNKIVVEALENHLDIKTSQPTPNEFYNAFESELKKGYDHIICLTLSKALSGTFNSASLAKDLLETDQITIIDSQSTTVGGEYIFLEALRVANNGASLEEVISHINETIKKGSIIFSVDNLSTLVKNGRLGRVSGFIGNVLKIKPILRFKEGVLTVETKVRGLLGSFNYIVNQAKEMISKSKTAIRIVYIDNEGYANRLYEMIKNIDSEIDIKIKGFATPVISSHIGLGGMGIYLTEK